MFIWRFNNKFIVFIRMGDRVNKICRFLKNVYLKLVVFKQDSLYVTSFIYP